MTKILTEVSWEVCNPVGGIYKLLESKTKHAANNFKQRYFLIGPWLEKNHKFIEQDIEILAPIKSILNERNLYCRIGYWDIEEKPAVILVGFVNRYDTGELLHNLWLDHGVDSLGAEYQYIEPTCFSTAAAEVIAAIHVFFSDEDNEFYAHFHEWMCGAGLLYLKKNLPQVSTVFTTHATVLGRALAGNNISIYSLDNEFDPDQVARHYNVHRQHNLEKATAKAAHCFTTVSDITADEAQTILGRYPDVIAYNGLNIHEMQNVAQQFNTKSIRKHLLKIASSVTGKKIPSNAVILLTSGRNEYHGKGFDTIIQAMANLQSFATKSMPDIVVLMAVAKIKREDNHLLSYEGNNTIGKGIAVFDDHYLDQNQIIKAVKEARLDGPDSKVHVIYSDAYFNGQDGVFNYTYDAILTSVDLTLFPSFYEPWGYTPQESIAYGVPTIITETTGFASFVNQIKKHDTDAVTIIPSKNLATNEVAHNLASCIAEFIECSAKEKEFLCKNAAQVSRLTDWKNFYDNYNEAYRQAREFNHTGVSSPDENTTLIAPNDFTSRLPRLYDIHSTTHLPKELKKLQEISHNFWWNWNDEGARVFEMLDKDLWHKLNRNPVRLLSSVMRSTINNRLTNQRFMQLYRRMLKSFTSYMDTKALQRLDNPLPITNKNPIAYFCLEFAIDQTLRIYSGGLGILAGDYIKTMSDLHIPCIGIGLFYTNGYFIQKISPRGEHVCNYLKNKPEQLPVTKVEDDHGQPVVIPVDVANRTIYSIVWQANVGRCKLYLLDTNIPENNPEDRNITDNLYVGLREKRLLQEVILGIGGSRFIHEILRINPSIYHLNEGHSAFLTVERLSYLTKQGFSLSEAQEIIKSSSVFTTHTQVPAGNEQFVIDLIKYYLSEEANLPNFNLNDLIKLTNQAGCHNFYMNKLALAFAAKTNSVSALHQTVAKRLWSEYWPNLLIEDIPIDNVTNGIHLTTWLGPELSNLFNKYMGSSWRYYQLKHRSWQALNKMPLNDLWEAHQKQKECLINEIKIRVMAEYSSRDEKTELINNTLNNLNKNTLIIGLARRFALYKRHYLLFKDYEKLVSLLNDPRQPLTIVVAGKAHPNDTIGKKIIEHLIALSRDERSNGRIIFLENYDSHLAKYLVQGVDVWMNTPIIYKEACGTSGMKAAINGGLNCSTGDGWWAEAYHDKIGWLIESYESIHDSQKRDELENLALINLLRERIIKDYYNKGRAKFSQTWVKMMRNSVVFNSEHFSTQRMVKDYVNICYKPTIKHTNLLLKNRNQVLQDLVVWKSKINKRFASLKIKLVTVNGIQNAKLTDHGRLSVKVLLFLGKMKAKELRIDLVIQHFGSDNYLSIPLKLKQQRRSGVAAYTARQQINEAGSYRYGLRVYPYHPGLNYPFETGLIYWI